jgi:hypothetical protein
MANEQKLDVQKIMDSCINKAIELSVDNMAAEYAHELSSCPGGSVLFDNPPDFTEHRNNESRWLQKEHMINIHGPCPAVNTLSTENTLGYDDWNIELSRLQRTLHNDTPSLETMFHQHVDAHMATMEHRHKRLAAYLVYRKGHADIPTCVTRKPYRGGPDEPIPDRYRNLTEREARRRMSQSYKSRA